MVQSTYIYLTILLLVVSLLGAARQRAYNIFILTSSMLRINIRTYIYNIYNIIRTYVFLRITAIVIHNIIWKNKWPISKNTKN